MTNGTTPFIGAIDTDNGWTAFIGQPAIFSQNTITVNYNGNGVAESFYQDTPFWASDDVNVLYPKFKMNAFNALFLITLIRQEKYRFSYGRKWHQERMKKSKIKLPIDQQGNPDWQFMENYIKSLPYSAAL
ncbi:MAG: restriction endonuclease subunit S [Rhodospirillales bacterium]|nr:restriction endonuclease subunit S [Rhodospirillales bacterium]